MNDIVYLLLTTYFSTSLLFHFSTSLRVDHELQQVAVRIANVDTRARLAAPTRAIHGTQFGLRSGGLEQRLQRGGGAIPHETEIAAWGPRCRRPRREGGILPSGRPVEVDHLAADVYRHRIRVLGHLKPETPIERDHRVRVLHRHR